jgi:archaeosortase B (VPXXXP-CTERM-specific)
MNSLLHKIIGALRKNYVLVRFYLMLLYCWLLLYFVLHWKVSHDYIAVYLPIFMAKSVAGLLRFFGMNAQANSFYVELPGFGFRIIYQCAGIFGMMIFASAVIAFPSTFKEKLLGMAMGIPGLYVINTIRMSVLGIIGIYWNDLFHFFHEWMWQGIFIIFVIVFWLIWKEKIVRSEIHPRVSG